VVKEVLRRSRDGGDGVLERLGVVAGRRAEAADLTDVLERGGPDVGVSDLLGEWFAECLDAAAHVSDVTPEPAAPQTRLHHGIASRGGVCCALAGQTLAIRCQS
jgi:hypothetical protein